MKLVLQSWSISRGTKLSKISCFFKKKGKYKSNLNSLKKNIKKNNNKIVEATVKLTLDSTLEGLK